MEITAALTQGQHNIVLLNKLTEQCDNNHLQRGQRIKNTLINYVSIEV